jgi:hypothetical protein
MISFILENCCSIKKRDTQHMYKLKRSDLAQILYYDSKLRLCVGTRLKQQHTFCDHKSPDIGLIPTSAPENKNTASNLPEKVLKEIYYPVKLSLLQEEVLALCKRLWYLPFSVMFSMVKLGFLHKNIWKLNNKAPFVFCASLDKHIGGHGHVRT